MKNLSFKQNDFLLKNNFSTILKCEINKMVMGYFRNLYIVPLDIDVFDKEISDLIIKLQDKIDDLKKNKKKKINTYKQLNSNTFKTLNINKKHIYKNQRSNKRTVNKYIKINSHPTYFKKSKKFIK